MATSITDQALRRKLNVYMGEDNLEAAEDMIDLFCPSRQHLIAKRVITRYLDTDRPDEASALARRYSFDLSLFKERY